MQAYSWMKKWPISTSSSIQKVTKYWFQLMFYGGFKEETEVCIKDTSVDEFKEFLQFFYLQEPTLTFENVPKVMELLDKYLLTGCFCFNIYLIVIWITRRAE